MFCSECGATAEGKFCAECGARLRGEGLGALVLSPAEWSCTTNYELLLRVPEVRDQIARSAAQSPKRMSGEQFLELCDKAFSPLLGVPLATVAQFAQPLYAKLGLKTGKSREQALGEPPGVVLVTVLCSLARHGHTVRLVHQLADGCVIEASLPSDVFSFEGDIEITVARRQQGTRVEAKTVIKGQLFDWGKSTRCLDVLFADLTRAAAA